MKHEDFLWFFNLLKKELGIEEFCEGSFRALPLDFGTDFGFMLKKIESGREYRAAWTIGHLREDEPLRAQEFLKDKVIPFFNMPGNTGVS